MIVGFLIASYLQVSSQALALPTCELELKALQFQMNSLSQEITHAHDAEIISKLPECSNYECVVQKEITKMIALQRQYESIEPRCRGTRS